MKIRRWLFSLALLSAMMPWSGVWAIQDDVDVFSNDIGISSDICQPSYEDDGILKIPCIAVQETFYAAKFQFIAPTSSSTKFDFKLIDVVELNTIIQKSICIAQYLSVGQLDIPCMSTTTEKLTLYADDPLAPNFFSSERNGSVGQSHKFRKISSETTSYFNNQRCNASTLQYRKDYCTLKNPFYQSGYGGQCTAHAWGRAYEFGIYLNTNGNAKTWYNQDVRDTITNRVLTKGKTVKPNSIAVWGGTGYGHVAYVQNVIGNRVIFTEGNWLKPWGGYGSGEQIGVQELDISSFEHRGSLNILGYIYLQDENLNLVDFWKKGDQNDPIYPETGKDTTFDAQFKLENTSNSRITLAGIALAIRKSDGSEFGDMMVWSNVSINAHSKFESGIRKASFYIAPGEYSVVVKINTQNNWKDLGSASFDVVSSLSNAPVSSDMENVFRDFSLVTADNIQTFLERYNGSLKDKSLGSKFSLDENEFYKAVRDWNLPELQAGINGKTPAQVIYLASKENNINPVLLLTKLQQEQSLITNVASQRVLNRATGYGIPNSNPAGDPRYASFLAQTTGLTYQFDLFQKRGYNIRQAYDKYTVSNTGQDASYDTFSQIYLNYKNVMQDIVSNTSSASSTTELTNFDGAGSLIKPSIDRTGANKDLAKMQIHTEPSTVVFQVNRTVNRDDNKQWCPFVELTTTSSSDMQFVVQTKLWNKTEDQDITVYKQSQLPLTIKFDKDNYYVIAVTSAKPLDKAIFIKASCVTTENITAEIDSSPTTHQVALGKSYFWSGTGSLISSLGDGVGIKKDYVITFPSKKSLASFQWLVTDSCKHLNFSAVNGNIILNADDNEVSLKKWDGAEWSKETCSSFPCSIGANMELDRYYIVKVKVPASNAMIKAECSQ